MGVSLMLSPEGVSVEGGDIGSSSSSSMISTSNPHLRQEENILKFNIDIPSPYTSGCSRKQSCIALNFSTQLIPFGSSSEKTKHENASLNCMPQGPWAIPPRHGQSQLISPVSGLNAPPLAPESSPPSAAGASGDPCDGSSEDIDDEASELFS